MRVAIVGYGSEGHSSYRYYLERGHDVTIFDERTDVDDLPAGASAVLGPSALTGLDGYDLVVRTPSLRPDKIKTDGMVWSATNEFFEVCRTPIIGVTGTKGKGTTASLIDSVLRAAGLKTVLVGNIGRPALDAVDEAQAADVVIYELSSFQLWDVKKSPHVAVILMIEPDHLDVHRDMREYVEAKANIRRFQTKDDICFYDSENVFSRQAAEANNAITQAHPFGVSDDPLSVYVEDGYFKTAQEVICPSSTLKLPGGHNLRNACAALSAARIFSQDSQAAAAGLSSFEGLPHRLKIVGQVGKARFVDDSIATTPGSARAAIEAFDGAKVLILGGSDKGVEFDGLIRHCAATNTKVVAIGTTGAAIAQLCRQFGVRCVEAGSAGMDEVVRLATGLLGDDGGTVILSPAAASFDMFKNYADRGDKFIAAVGALER